MPIYSNTDIINSIKGGNINIGSAYLGYTVVYGEGEDRFQVPVSNGLVSLYNPAYTSSAINGYDSGTIIDLWGSNDLETAGDPVNVESDGAIYFYTGSYASSSAELSADLLGASAEFTVIVYSYQTISGSTDVPYGNGRFKIGGAGRDNTTNIIAELADDNYPVSIGATSASFAATSIYYPIRYNNGGGQQNVRYAKSNYLASPPYPENIASSSFAAYSKADQNASYTKPATNLSVYLDTFWQGNVYAEEQKTTIGIAQIGDTSNGDLYVFDSADGNIPDVLETYITESFLILNPTFTSGGSSYDEPSSFALKGFAVYNRVLTTAEIQSMKSWFDESY
jgi:hypothetical protein